LTTLVPANIAIVKNAPNKKAAGAFIEYLLSPAGQEVLLNPKIRRLPVNPATYAKAPKGFPNPFKDKSIGSAVKFDLGLSKSRYNIINSLFDVMITYRLDDLRDATKAIQIAEKKQMGKSNGAAMKMISEARELIAQVPIDDTKASENSFNKIFKKKRKKASTKVTGRQAEFEQAWDTQIKANYAKAKELANKAASM
jgi:phosphoglycerate transport regulatory protein PgtC